MIVHSLFYFLPEIVQGVWYFDFRLNIIILNNSCGNVRSVMGIFDFGVQSIDAVCTHVRDMLNSWHFLSFSVNSIFI